VIDHLLRFIIPSGYALLPPKLYSVRATALLIAIGLQESRFEHRRQINGPARGFWQFEAGGGALGVLTHERTEALAKAAIARLKYPLETTIAEAHEALEHNDTLAFVFARLLLWTVPGALPFPQEPDRAWWQYIEGWRPGRPRRSTWDAFYREAWDFVAPNPDEPKLA
jgi:hypothetical protein